MEFSFLEQMEENVKYNLIYPYHIDFEKLTGHDNYNPDYKDSYHCHTFEEVLHKAYLEPKAFYLTEDDAFYYSNQEIEFISKVTEQESYKLDNNMELVDLELSDESLQILLKYKTEHNMTLEEAVIDILTKALKNDENN